MFRRHVFTAGLCLRQAWKSGNSEHVLPYGSTSAAAALPTGVQKLGVALKYLAGVGVTVWGTQQEDLLDKASLAWLIAVRLTRDVVTAASIVADYKTSMRDVSPEEREEVLHACHQRSADKLLDLCFKNGGIYIKLGQHIGQLDHLLPEPYVFTMRAHLLNSCPTSPWPEVHKIITQDLGAPPEQLFASFDQQPIASASLAQVHVATSHSGEKLAVKVQHAGLRESCSADVATVEMLVHAAKRVFPEFDYQWLVDEIKENLPKELDFMHEADNAARCRANLESTRSRVGSRVHVPEVKRGLTSARVLTMEFVDGVGVTDLPGLRRMGADPRRLSSLISEAFSEMVFIHGYVHCDPHAANMLVRRKDGRAQLVLLDHGLYRQIDDDFRREYAALWRSLVFADHEGIKRHSAAMNAGEAYILFASILTQRPWEHILESSVDHLDIKDRREHKERAAEFVSTHVKDINELLLRMPRPLLLLLKTNDCLRAVDSALGQPINTFVITARQCTRALAEERVRAAPGLGSRCRAAAEQLRVEAVIGALVLMTWWGRLRAAWWPRERPAAAAAAAVGV